MNRESKSHFPFICAVGIHLLLFAFLIIHFNLFEKVKPATAFVSNVKIVNAVTVNQRQVENEIKKIKQAEQQKKIAEQEQLKKLEEEKERLVQQKLEEQRKLEDLKRQKQIAEQQQKLAEKLALQKLTDLKEKQKKLQEAEVKKQKEAEKVAKLEKTKLEEKKKLELAEKEKFKKAEEKLLEEQLNAEEKAMAAANNKRMMSEIERYTALITHAVGRRWIVPDSANENTRCVLLIRLEKDGSVLDVKLLKSSGDDAVDRSAQTAVYRASPLPVPENPELFEKFREIKLVVKPDGYLS